MDEIDKPTPRKLPIKLETEVDEQTRKLAATEIDDTNDDPDEYDGVDDFEADADAKHNAALTEMDLLKAQLASAQNALKQIQAQGNSLPSHDITTLIANSVAEALKQAIPAAAVGVTQAQQAAIVSTQEAKIRQAQKKLQRCPVCLQPVSACGGAFEVDKDGAPVITKKADGSIIYKPEINHIMYYVGPKDEDLWEWFQPVRINNVPYLSNYYGHLIWIPKKSDIPTIVNRWERNEKDLSKRRKGEGRGMNHRFGTNASSAQPAIGWR